MNVLYITLLVLLLGLVGTAVLFLTRKLRYYRETKRKEIHNASETLKEGKALL